MKKKLVFLVIGGIKRAFTANGGGYLTVTAPKTDEFDPQAYIALFLRGLVAVGLAWVALKMGVPIPDINTL
jgi:hypothetical protein